MVCCYECGVRFESRENEGQIQVFDTDREEWTSECPSCGRIRFDEEDYEEDYDEDYDEDKEYY
jgi:predicted  nucleic acid-binding Zn-ribbon protein